MAPLSLSQLLDVAIGTPQAGAVNFTALYSLLQAMLGHLGLQDLPAPGRGHSPTPLLGRDQPPEAPPREEGGQGGGPGTESLTPAKDPLQGAVSTPQDASAVALSQDLLEEIGGMKAAQSRMEEDIRMIQETLGMGNLQDAAGQLPALRDQTALDSDVVRPRARPDPAPGRRRLRARGASAPSASSAPNMDTPHGASSALGLKGPGTQPAPRTSKGTSEGTPQPQPGSLGTQRAPVAPEKGAGASSDKTKTSDARATTLGTQTGTPGIKTTTLGTESGAPDTQTSTPGAQPGSSDTQSTTPGVQPGAPSTQTTTPRVQPGAPSTQTTTPRVQPGSPGIQTTTPGVQPTPPGTQGGGAGLQPSPFRMDSSLSGTEKVPAEALPDALGTQMEVTSPKEGGKALSSPQLAWAGHPAVGTLSLTAQGLEIPLDTDPRATSPSQEPPMPWGSSGSIGVSDRYAETVEALRQIGQLSHLCATLKERVAQLEATKSDHAELEKLRLLFSEGDKESIASVLADLQGRVSSLQGLTSDLQGKNGKIRQLEDALGKLEVAGANWKGDVSDQITLQLGSTLQEVKCKLKELEEQQEMTKATLERLVAKTADELREQLGEPRATVASTGQEQAEVQAECPVCSTDISKQVGQLLQRYEKLQELVDDCMSRQAAGKVVRQLPGRSQDEELLKRIQAAVTQVQGDYEQLNSVTGNLLNDRHQKEKDIEALFRSLERLEKEKASKEDLVLGIDVKADKTALAGKVSRTQFDASMERLNEMIQETLSRVTGQEQGWHQVQRQLSEEMDSKLDRLELGPFRQQLEEHWRSTLEQLKEREPLTEADDAAGMKKQLLAHFHCMSCDRPLSVLVPGPHIVAIPYVPPLPPHLAGRSHTVLEMEQTPQHSHRERVAECGYPSVPRRCGGRHTLTHPLQRGPRRQPHPPGTPRPLQPPTLLPVKHDETELLGQDGHIYRGRRGVQLPVLVGKEDFPRAKPKLSPRQWDARDTSRLLSRPQSAASSLSQPGIPTSPEHRPASSHRRLSQARGLLLPPQPSWDGSSTSEARQDWGSPTEPPAPRPPSRRASISDQQQ
ncbi:unnamed protein product [Bubo scandiacus]